MSGNKGLSVMVYAIVLVIILAVVMIISAPMMVDEYKNDNKQQKAEEQNNGNYNRSDDRYVEENFINITDEMRNIETRLSSRIDELEMQANETVNTVPAESISDKYICEIEGVKNEYGNTVPITEDTDISAQKIVFVCEYRR